MKSLAVSAILVCVASPALTAVCPLLQYEKVEYESDSGRLSLAWEVTIEEYIAKSKSGGGRATIYGVPVGANYSEYRSNIRKEAESLKIDKFETYASVRSHKEVGENELKAYLGCITSPGLYLSVSNFGVESYTINIKWIPFGKFLGRDKLASRMSTANQNCGK